MNSVWINGIDYSIADYSGENDKSRLNDLPSFERSVIALIDAWDRGQEVFTINTSGSTGQPKLISLSRAQMKASAENTLEYLKLKKGCNILLCLDPGYIAGMMQVVRAIVGDCNLYAIEPSSLPFQKLKTKEKFSLCSMVPMQVIKTMDSPDGVTFLESIDHVLIGGGDLDLRIESQLSEFHNSMYHTFGMTESVTHVALRKINGPERRSYYQFLPGIEFKTDERDCLVIKGEVTNNKWVITNDVVEWIQPDGFIWKGRHDYIINSGGKKTLAEFLEKKIKRILSDNKVDMKFIISGEPDPLLGERIIMILADNKQIDLEKLKSILMGSLDKHEMPRVYYRITENFLLDKDKINRSTILKNVTPLD